MAAGYATRYYKRATSANFDGSATAKTLWLFCNTISAIYCQITKTVDETAVLRGYWRVVIEMFTRTPATPLTNAAQTAYNGGAWSEVWSGYLFSYNGATATKDANENAINIQWRPALVIPTPFNPSIVDPITTSATFGIETFPNTHNASPVAGESDLRLYFTNLGGDTTNTEFTATVLCPE